MDLLDMCKAACVEANESGISWSELASHAGVSRSTIWRMINGKHTPHTATLQQIWDSADLLKRAMDDASRRRRLDIAEKLGLSLDD